MNADQKKTSIFTKVSDTNLLLAITIVVFLLMYTGAVVIQGGAFTKPKMFFDILNANAALIITSIGMSIVMISGGIDISVGGVVALVSMCCAVHLDKHGGSIFGSILIALGIGLAFGIVQGFLVAYLDIQPFIVSLAGMFFARGMTTIVNTDPFNVENAAFKAMMETKINVPGMGRVNSKGIYVPAYVEPGVIVAILLVILLFLVLRYTKTGRSFLCGRRKPAERPDARGQCKAHPFSFPSDLFGSGGDRRVCIFPARRQRCCIACDRNGDECDRVLHYRRDDAVGRCRQSGGYTVWGSVVKHDPEYRIKRRSGTGLVDGDHDRFDAVYLPGDPEYPDGTEEACIEIEQGFRSGFADLTDVI